MQFNRLTVWMESYLLDQFTRHIAKRPKSRDISFKSVSALSKSFLLSVDGGCMM